MSKLVLYGAGGHAKVVAEIAEQNGYSELVFCEDEVTKSKIWEYSVLSKVDKNCPCVLAIGNNAVRKKLAETRGNQFPSLIHPRTQISNRAQIGEGSVIMAGVSINAAVVIGKHCIINTNASEDHDCVIENYVHLSPNVALAGTVHIGEGTHVGIGACVIQGVHIGKWCTIGAGAVVIRDVPDGATIVGNPGRVIKAKE